MTHTRATRCLAAAAATAAAAAAATCDRNPPPRIGHLQDGLRSGLEVAAGITGKAVPWVIAAATAAAAAAAATTTSPRSPSGDTAADADPDAAAADAAASSSPPPSLSLPPSPTRALSVASHASTPGRGLVLPQPRVSPGQTAWSGRVVGWGVAAVEALALRAICRFLRHTVAKGCMTIVCPDGRELRFGEPGSVPAIAAVGDGTSSGAAGRRVGIRVFDWWFFVRVAMEYDLGLARCGAVGRGAGGTDRPFETVFFLSCLLCRLATFLAGGLLSFVLESAAVLLGQAVLAASLSLPPPRPLERDGSSVGSGRQEQEDEAFPPSLFFDVPPQSHPSVFLPAARRAPALAPGAFLLAVVAVASCPS